MSDLLDGFRRAHRHLGELRDERYVLTIPLVRSCG